jgi:hypothetical protein
MSANEPQMLRYEYSQATKILDAEYKPASLDDVIKTCENLHVEEHNIISSKHYSKIINLQYLLDGSLREFKMEPISLLLMHPNCKPMHARAYTVPRSMEQQL